MLLGLVVCCFKFWLMECMCCHYREKEWTNNMKEVMSRGGEVHSVIQYSTYNPKELPRFSEFMEQSDIPKKLPFPVPFELAHSLLMRWVLE